MTLALTQLPRHRAAARRHLRSADPAWGPILDAVGRCRLEQHTGGSHFAYVMRAIVYQQLSGKAAATIYGRVQALYPEGTPTPAAVRRTPHATLRAAGLSERKAEYVVDLARRAAEADFAIERLHEMPDAAVIETLVSVRGIGRWTAQMALMFRLGRPDVLPELDLGIQKAVQRMRRMRKLPTPEQLQRIGAPWAPYRTIASWYLWRSLEVELP
jgi:DNA-3-methyladenine glycosylase II